MSNRPRKAPASLRSSAAQRAQEQARAAERARTRTQRRIAWICGSIAVVLLVAGITAFALTRSSEPAPELDQEAVALGCSSCHTIDGARSEGPTWQGLAGSQVQLADGTTVVADDAYFRRAILDPQAQVVAGYPAMPAVPVTEAQADRLVAYIRSLSD